MTSAKRVAFIGLGAMGYPMAGRLATSGHTVTVFNRTQERAQRWQRTVRRRGGRNARGSSRGSGCRDDLCGQ